MLHVPVSRYVNVAPLWILFLIWNSGTMSALIFHHQPAFSNTPHCWFHYRSRNTCTSRERARRERGVRTNFSTVRITGEKMPCFAEIWRKVSDRWQASLWQENVFMLALFISSTSACLPSLNLCLTLQSLFQVSLCVGCWRILVVWYGPISICASEEKSII